MTPQELEALLAERQTTPHWRRRDAIAWELLQLAPALLDLWRAAESWDNVAPKSLASAVLDGHMRQALARLREVKA